MGASVQISPQRWVRCDAAPVRRGIVTLLLAAVLSAAGLINPSPAAACSCAGGTTEQYFADANAVFTGTLLSRTVDHPDWPVISSLDPALLGFAADLVYKGDVHARQGVVTASEGASCGLELAGDGPFVVFATRDPDLPEGQYRAGLCGGTTTSDDAVVAELENLSGLAASPGTPGPAPRDGQAGLQSSGLGPAPTVLIGIGVLAVLAAGWVLLRRRRATR